MKFGKFLSALTQTQREDFSKIIAINNKLLTVSSQKYSQFLQPSFPTTNHFINSVYIREKFSVMENLQWPVVKIMDEHTYVSLQDIIAHLLAFTITNAAPIALWNSRCKCLRFFQRSQ
jgi:hypothetical protein